ncbi:hypothetical protein SUGI_1189160 [Cryptomeria japonica]|nr:hypothetical protein SUGI_1189160 [Cryptomeria japonica]
MENEEGREILIFGKRIRVGGENNGSVSHENGNEKGEKRKYIKSLMPRIRWTSDLHDSFLRALQHLGGPNKASPKQLVELMGVEGLTHPQVKSHLQENEEAPNLNDVKTLPRNRMGRLASRGGRGGHLSSGHGQSSLGRGRGHR